MRADSKNAKPSGVFPQLKELMLGDEQRELSALRESVEDQERFLGELRDGLEEKRRELAALRGALEEKGSHISGLHEGLEDQEQRLTELRSGLGDQEGRVTDLSGGLDDQGAQISGLRKNLEENASRISDLRKRDEVGQRDRTDLREGLEDKERQLTALRDELEDKDAQISGLRDDSEGARRERAELRHNLDEKERLLTDFQSGLEDKERQLVAIRRALEEKESRISELRKGVEFGQEERVGLRKSLEEQGHHLTELRGDLEAKGPQIAGLRDDLEDKAARISDLREDLKATGAQVSELQTGHADTESRISDLREDLKATGAQVSELRTGHEDTESRISSLSEGVESGQRERSDLREDLEEKERALAELRENLEAERREFDALRKSLENGQRHLNALRERLDAQEAHSVERIAGDLAAALRRRKELGQESFDDFVAALQSGTESAIQRSVSTDKKTLSTTLFPIMGPAIRNYVVELFRNMAAELNETISNATSVERIQWRFQARMAGKPYSEYVLLKTRSFRIEEVYLMQRDTGLLLLHAALNPEDEADGEADLVSGMFTAIRSFVRDSFAQGDGADGSDDGENGDEEELDSFTFGEREVLIEVGPSMVLAAVAHGVPAPSVRNELKRILENLHAELQDRLDHFSGDTAELEESRPILRSALCENRAESEAKSGSGGFGKLWLALGAIGLGMAAWIFIGVREQSHWNRFESALRAKPGIVVTEVKSTGWWRHREVRGLRDPLAMDPSILAGEYEIDPEKTSFAFGLMKSLEPDINARRTAADAKEKTAMLAQQEALLAQLETLRKLQAKSEADNSARAAKSTETLVRSLFADIPSLDIEFTDDGIRFQGDLAEDDYTLALSRLEPLKAVDAVDTSGLSSNSSQGIAALLQRISTSSISYRAGTLEEEDEAQINQLAVLLGELNDIASKAETSYAFTILAHPLISPNREANRSIEERRADQVRQRLIGKGLAPEILETRVSEDFARAGQGVTVLPAERSREP